MIKIIKQQRTTPGPLLSFSSPKKQYSGEIVSLLENKGYNVVSDKLKIPISIVADDKPMESRLFVDYLAEKDGLLYVVKVGKQRKPLLFNGASLRDQLLPFYLLYRPNGIIYVTDDKKDIKIIHFNIENKQPPTSFNVKSAIFWLGLGIMLSTILIK